MKNFLMNEKKYRLFFIVGFSVVVSIGMILFIQPFKITDPADPRFNPDKFSFHDYTTDELRKAFKILFPVGTPESFVDRLLVDAGGAKKDLKEFSGGTITTYESGALKPVLHDFIFSKDKTVLNAYPVNGSALYKNQIRREDIIKELQ